MNSPIKYIVLHYSATYPDQDLDVEDIRKMHLARGFNDVGYHYIIKRDGTVQKGRADNVVGAHVAGHNTGSLGICCIGGIERATGPNVGVDNRTQAQKDATVLLVQDLLRKHPTAQVVGHRDMPGAKTQCPGFNAQSWWASVDTGSAETVTIKEMPVIRRGSTGEAVRQAQRLMGLKADGMFGPRTEAAAIAFQRRGQLLPDGIIGRATWAALQKEKSA